MEAYLAGMLDDDGNVTEECEAVPTEATCEDGDECGEAPGLQWTTASGMEYFACWKHLATDEYVRVRSVFL
jgi:hypothetical protein